MIVCGRWFLLRVQTTPDGETYMRIVLDRQHLLGFEAAARDVVELPAHAAKVGTKDNMIPTASHADLARLPATKTTLTFPG